MDFLWTRLRRTSDCSRHPSSEIFNVSLPKMPYPQKCYRQVLMDILENIDYEGPPKLHSKSQRVQLGPVFGSERSVILGRSDIQFRYCHRAPIARSSKGFRLLQWEWGTYSDEDNCRERALGSCFWPVLCLAWGNLRIVYMSKVVHRKDHFTN